MAEAKKLTQAEEDELTAKRYFYGGFLGLPLLWLLMAIHFWPKARKSGSSPALKFYVNGALVGSLVVFAGIIGWFIYFQLNWRTSETLKSLLVVPVYLVQEI